ncbi:hypothetical protein MLDJOKPK_00036 [Salmonella phage SPAsTU]|nr:hypothetical protein STsAS_098 [Salmonella phage STsAS]AXF51066.1 hypothetical protein MLDJOKPK_00036 [Salmonella phage SPAsTU]
MTKLVSFSAGLDSTWIMYQLMCKATPTEAHYVRPAYFSMWNGGDANFMEMLMSVAIVERLMDLHHARVDHVTWATLTEDCFEPLTTPNHPNGWSPLIQQGNVVQGLAKLMHGITRKEHHSAAYLGWNKMDALENSHSMGDWSLDEYARLKKLYSEIMYFQDHAGRIPPLQTPAWDKDKTEMWSDLPENIRELIQVSNFNNYEFAFDREQRMLWVYANPCAKSRYYNSIGINPAVAWRISINQPYKDFWYSKLGASVSKLGLSVPKAAQYRHLHRRPEPYTVHEDAERLVITAYTAEEWCGLSPDFKALQEREKERERNAKASKTVDAPTGEVAQS